MSDLVRLSLSLDENLYNKMEELVKKSNRSNRSEYIREILRAKLIEQEWDAEQKVVGTLSLVYDHEKRSLSKKLNKLQHSKHNLVLALIHVHISHSVCAEMIMLRGKAGEILKLVGKLKQQIGILHSGLVMGTLGSNLNKHHSKHHG